MKHRGGIDALAWLLMMGLAGFLSGYAIFARPSTPIGHVEAVISSPKAVQLVLDVQGQPVKVTLPKDAVVKVGDRVEVGP